SRHVAEPIGGAEAGREDQLHCLRIGQPVCLLRRNDAPFDSFALDRLNIDAFTVILERNDDEAVRVSGREPQTARTGLATCHLLLELIGDAADVQGGLLQVGQRAVVAVLIDQRIAQLNQARTVDHELADQIEQRVESGDVNANGGCVCSQTRTRRRGRRRGGRLDWCYRLSVNGGQLGYTFERIQEDGHRHFRADQNGQAGADGEVLTLYFRLRRLARQHATVLAERPQRLQRANRR